MTIDSINSLHAHVAYHVIPERNSLQGEISRATESTNVIPLLIKYYSLLNHAKTADEWINTHRTTLSGNAIYYQIRKDIIQTVSLIDKIHAVYIKTLSNSGSFSSVTQLYEYVTYYVIPETYDLKSLIKVTNPDDDKSYTALLAAYNSLKMKANKAERWISLNFDSHRGTHWETTLTIIKKDLTQTLQLINNIHELYITPLLPGSSVQEVRSYTAHHITPLRISLESAIEKVKKPGLHVETLHERISLLLYAKNDLMHRMDYVTRHILADSKHIETNQEVKLCENIDKTILELCKTVFTSDQKTLDTLQTDAINGKGSIIQPPIGINNQSNNCWINALMQLLINIPAFKVHLLDNLPQDYRYFAARYLTDRFHGLRVTGAHSQAIRVAISKQFKGIISPHCFENEDASEALMLLLGLIKEGERISKQLPMSPENFTLHPLFHWMRTTRHYKITPMIAPHLGSSMCDLNTKGCSIQYNPEMQIILHLPLAQSIQFETLMDRFFYDNLSDSDQGLYNQTRLDLEYISRSFLMPPEHLTIITKRFHMLSDGSFQKTDTPIQIPDLYTLPEKYVENGQTAKYQLKAIIQHLGKFGIGHYITYIKDDKETWWKCDDQSVSSITQEALNQAKQTSYFTYFERQASTNKNP